MFIGFNPVLPILQIQCLTSWGSKSPLRHSVRDQGSRKHIVLTVTRVVSDIEVGIGHLPVATLAAAQGVNLVLLLSDNATDVQRSTTPTILGSANPRLPPVSWRPLAPRRRGPSSPHECPFLSEDHVEKQVPSKSTQGLMGCWRRPCKKSGHMSSST